MRDTLYIIVAAVLILLSGCAKDDPPTSAAGEPLEAAKAYIDAAKPTASAAGQALLDKATAKIVEGAAKASAQITGMSRRIDALEESATHHLWWFQGAGLVGLGIGVVIIMLLKDVKFGAAVAAAGVVVAIGATLLAVLTQSLIAAIPVLKWIIIALPLVGVAWVAIEWKLRGSLKAALMTDPITDIVDAIHGGMTPTPTTELK